MPFKKKPRRPAGGDKNPTIARQRGLVSMLTSLGGRCCGGGHVGGSVSRDEDQVPARPESLQGQQHYDTASQQVSHQTSQQTSQQASQQTYHLDYVNLPAHEQSAAANNNSSNHCYMNIQPQCVGPPTERMTEYRMTNYMEMDFTSGVGLPVSAAVQQSCRLNYAQLVHQQPTASFLTQTKADVQLRRAAAASTSSASEVAYCELDHRAMDALVATAKEEAGCLGGSSSLPRLRLPQHPPETEGSRLLSIEPPPKSHGSSLTRLRSSLTRSLSRLPFRRPQSQQSQNS